MVNRSLRWLVAVCFLCLWVICINWSGWLRDAFAQLNSLSSENHKEAPAINLTETSFAFGIVDEGSVVSHDFIVKNAGKAELQISKVTPDWGCAVAHFDRAIPPGGEGKITLKANLRGYKGNVKKTATVICNDPQAPRVSLALHGTVRTLIDVRPTNTVSFRGMAGKIGESVIELVGGTQPFHITKVDTNLEDKVAHKLETAEDGKHYRLKLTNLLKQGSYSGFVTLHTDLAQKNDIIIRVNGFIDGEISVNPKTLLVGKLAAQQPVRTGKVTVASNSSRPFKIAKLTYDNKIIQVVQNPISNQPGFSLEIIPRTENIPSGARQQTVLTIETDVASGEKIEVQVQVFNSN